MQYPLPRTRWRQESLAHVQGRFLPRRSVPYLQLDVPNPYPVEVKRGLARRLGEKYARIMQTTPEQVTVAFRELGEGGVWRCSAGEPEPAALLSCDIRRGRPPEQRAELAQGPFHPSVGTVRLGLARLVAGRTPHTSGEGKPVARRAGGRWAT